MCDKVCSPLGSKMFYIWQKQRLKMIWYTHEKHNEPVLCLILHLLGNSLIHSLHHSHALSLMLDRFQTNNMLTCSHQLLYNNLAWHTYVSCWVTCTFYLTLLMANIKNRKKLQLIQTIWNVTLYLQQFTFHWIILVLVNNFVREWLAWTQVANWASVV